MTGLQSDDYGYGQTGVIMAELLGLPHATIVIEVDASGDKLRVKRELESGWYQWYTMPTPALLTIQSGISQIRYATLKGIMAAKKKEIKEVTPSAEIVSRPSHQQLKRVYLPQKTKQTQMLGNGDAKAGAVELAEKLHVEARDILMSNGILVFIEHRNGVVNKSSLEAIAAAQSLGSQLQQQVSAVVLGSDPEAMAQEIAGLRSGESHQRQQRETGELHTGRLRRRDGAGGAPA